MPTFLGNHGKPPVKYFHDNFMDCYPRDQTVSARWQSDWSLKRRIPVFRAIMIGKVHHMTGSTIYRVPTDKNHIFSPNTTLYHYVYVYIIG
jgi:hypothetical protein